MLESVAQSNAANDARAAAYNSGTIECRSGARDTIAAEPVGTLLATLTFSADAFGDSVNRVITANAITADSSADEAGTIGHIVCKSSGGTILSVHTASLTGGAGEAQFESLTTEVGKAVTITSFAITQPDGA
jgi:hypothetical protein